MGPEDLPVAGATIGVEYMTVLQYLLNKYGCGDCEQGEQYFEFAVDEMRHLSWAATYLPGLVAAPKPPDVPADRVRLVRSAAEAREAATVLEGNAGEFYSARIAETRSAALAEDLGRAAGQHAYHRYRLGDMR